MRSGARAAGQAASEAADRRARGGRVYSVVVELESARAGAAPDLSDVIEQVESGGWHLDRVEAAALAAHARPMVLLIFRVA